DDLPRVAGVGEGLLVARHAGGEDGLTEGTASRAVRAAGEPAAVLEYEDRGGGVDHADASPSGVWGVSVVSAVVTLSRRAASAAVGESSVSASSKRSEWSLRR